ncbi:MAG: putative U4/U6.U5 tri-snRNP-associated protein 2 [Streblomastix strix]|uniref:Putative U4/U6.U5 tri-snRNP-associated protein 2 n=1 Tax=Streblomastix strix TaxID=222440 RepID=A0A5J4UM57_9EUKA|nr:MAG: putative U4/U6.U5 tri-snRNP-associated protein 2 [Streblomastix strix]
MIQSKKRARQDDTFESGIPNKNFDFEKKCSVTLSNVNVYACLVCGRYFQGRGQSTMAFKHALQEDHHVFMNMDSLKAYCLPDGYEIIDFSLDDIKRVIRPRISEELIKKLDDGRSIIECKALNGTIFYPGFIGLNNIGNNGYINTVVQALIRVSDFRNYFLSDRTYDQIKQSSFVIPPTSSSSTSSSQEQLPITSSNQFILSSVYGELVRKMFNTANFKPHVSPHSFVQLIDILSQKRFPVNDHEMGVQRLGMNIGRGDDGGCY